jgi:hypothetical protein
MTDAWLEDAFFEEAEPDSLDGGTTNRGPLWHAVSPRWGHVMHSMCSYQGMFPPRLAHYFVSAYTQQGETVLDPFSGRGTTSLQARVEGRRAISNDLSPLGFVLSAAKARPPDWTSLMSFVNQLESDYQPHRFRTAEVSPDIQMLFHANTLGQLLSIKEHLFARRILEWSPEELMVAGAIAGILHGNHRQDGSSAYLSISMPNTFSMPPAYVRRFIADHHLIPPDQNVFERLRDKLARIYLDSTDGPNGSTYCRDAVALLQSKAIKPGSVDLVFTSPPYLKVVNYGTSNWIRLWWLGVEEVSTHGGAGRKKLNSKLDHDHRYKSYERFMLQVLQAIERVLKPNGIAVIVIGDVETSNVSYSLASQIWTTVGQTTGLTLIDLLEDSLPGHSKVSRIWRETKGRATDQEGILILGREDAEQRLTNPEVDWDEPYKDGGPDAAHARMISGRAVQHAVHLKAVSSLAL